VRRCPICGPTTPSSLPGASIAPKSSKSRFFLPSGGGSWRALDARIPILGICLGNQLLAHWLGGEVITGRWEIGWLPIAVNEEGLADPLLAGLGEEFYGFLWHGDQNLAPAEQAVLLASSEKCRVQAFRLRDSAGVGRAVQPPIRPGHRRGVIRAAKTLPQYGYDLDEMVATGYREDNDVAGKIFGNFFDYVLKGQDDSTASAAAASATPAADRPGHDAP